MERAVKRVRVVGGVAVVGVEVSDVLALCLVLGGAGVAVQNTFV